MKKIMMSLSLVVSVSIAAFGGTSENLIQKEDRLCQDIIGQATVLNQGKEIPTLTKTRKAMRETLERMHLNIAKLQKEGKLQAKNDYLLSIDEGIKSMDYLAEEPMTKANLDQIVNMCQFITLVDSELIDSLALKASSSYRTVAR